METSLPSIANAPIPLVSGADFNPESLTTEGLLAYVSTRLQTVDGQIDELFEKQQNADKVRSALKEIQTQLGRLEERKNDPTKLTGSDNVDEIEVKEEIEEQLRLLEKIAPDVYQRLRENLTGKDGLLTQLDQNATYNHTQANLDDASEFGVAAHNGAETPKTDSQYTGLAVTAALEGTKSITSDLDATAQLDMIKLQSLTSARQTAISLATNLLAGVGDSFKAIVANTRG